MLPQPSIRIDGDVIHITNGYSRGRSIFLIVIAAFIAILPLARPYLPANLYVYSDDGLDGWAIGLFGIFAVLSAAIWWSTVVIDPKADEIAVRRRWGLFRSNFRQPLSSYSAVAVREDDDRCVSVYLEPPAAGGGMDFNHGKAILWGRESEEAHAIAKKIAAHLKFDLNDYRPVVLPKLPV